MLIFLILSNLVRVQSLKFCHEELSSSSPSSSSTTPPSRSNNILRLRIIGGTPADTKQGNLNWMGKLISYGETREGMLCGATVIDDHWVLTAAHCANQFKTHSYVYIRQPATWFFKEEEIKISVDKYFIHPKYDNLTAINDVALLWTTTSFESKGITPVCLTRDDTSLLEKYSNGIVIGYGQTLKNTSTPDVLVLQPSKTLQQTVVPIIPASQCYKTWSFISFLSVLVSPNQLCAGAYLHGTAPGDSGGPLLIKTSDGRYIQVGITSFGADGLEGLIDQGHYPGVYTRVSKYIPWIEQVIDNSTTPITASCLPILMIFCILYIF